MLATHADAAGRTAAESTKSNENIYPEAITPSNPGDKMLECISLDPVARTNSRQNTKGHGREEDEKRGEIEAVAAEEGSGIDGVGKLMKTKAEEREAAMVRAQMSVLMLGFYEIVRQVSSY